MEHYNYNGKEIIGIDHGFGNIKCRHVVFRSGVKAYDSEPAMTADALFYDGRYYVVGEEHKGFVSDKSQDEDYYILTVAALAKELEFRHIGTSRNVRPCWRWGCLSSGSARRKRPFANI